MAWCVRAWRSITLCSGATFAYCHTSVASNVQSQVPDVSGDLFMQSGLYLMCRCDPIVGRVLCVLGITFVWQMFVARIGSLWDMFGVTLGCD